MKQLFISLLCVLLLASCFEKTPLESAEHIPLDSICHYYTIELNEADSMVQIGFFSWPITNRNKRLLIPNVDEVKINDQILKLGNNSYKLNIPIQNIKDDIITISYFSSDTVFYSKRIKLARFYFCKLDFDRDMFHNSIGVYFEPALNTLEELSVELKSKTDVRKRFSYDESIRNGISFKKNMITYDELHKTATIQLEKTFEEKYTEPISIQIKASTRIERDIKYVPNYYSE
jgi:hypothetical protein